jgi:RNA polymerase sigma factor (sigma-70 family)
MEDMEDGDLLREYAASKSEKAFTELVNRYIHMVHSTASRLVGDSDRASDITQTVFITLARNASSIRNPGSLAGWLFRTTRLTTARFKRAEARRERRETSAMAERMNGTETTTDAAMMWQSLAADIDDAIGTLNPKDQDAIALRFFQQKSLREVGMYLGLSEDATQKRITRTLEKLREFFKRRGITTSVSLLSAALAGNAVQAAPMGLASTIAVASLKTAAGTVGTGTLIFTIMTATKSKLAISLIAMAVVSTSVILKQKAATSYSEAPQQVESVTAQKVAEIQKVEAPANKSVDEIVAELQRLSTVSDYALRHSGIQDLARSVALQDVAMAIARAEKLSDSRVKSPFIHLLLARLAKSDPLAALACAKALSTRERVIEGVQTVLDVWVEKDQNEMVAWLKTIPKQGAWPDANLHDEAIRALSRVDPQAALELVNQGESGSREAWYSSIYRAWAVKDLTSALAAAEKLPSGELKNQTLSAVIASWAVTDPTAAAGYIGAMPPSPLRKALISQVAQAWGDAKPEQAAEWVSTLSNSRERWQAASYMVQGFAAADPKTAAQFVQTHFSESPDYLRPWTIVSEQFAKKDLKGAVEWMKQIPSESLRAVAFNSLATEWAHSDPAAAAAFARTLPNEDPNSAGLSEAERILASDRKLANERVLQSIITEWSHQDPKAALKSVEQFPDSNQGTHLNTALRTWAKSNPQEAARYVAADMASGDLQMSAAAAVASVWATSDPLTAAEWVIRFPDGSVKERAMSGLVSSWAASDVSKAENWLSSQTANQIPAETIASFVAAASKSAPAVAANWSERLPPGAQQDALVNLVAGTWSGIDSAACTAWIQKSSLPLPLKERLLRSK